MPLTSSVAPSDYYKDNTEEGKEVSDIVKEKIQAGDEMARNLLYPSKNGDAYVSTSALNTARYGDKIVGKKDVYVLFKEARAFTNEPKQEYEKTKPHSNIMQQEAKRSVGR